MWILLEIYIQVQCTEELPMEIKLITMALFIVLIVMKYWGEFIKENSGGAVRVAYTGKIFIFIFHNSISCKINYIVGG